jgi:exodeoxyribonuclease V beta subunit
MTNYRHILEKASEEASRLNLDFHGVLERLNRYRDRTQVPGEDFDLHRLETEKPKVQILTIHTAKGIEYPVVFVCGGFTSYAGDDSYLKYHDNTHRTVYDLVRQEAGLAQCESERQFEEERLFYVALTRAKYKLYVPKFSMKKHEYRAGPLAYLVSEAIGKTFKARAATQAVGIISVSGRGEEGEGSDELPEPFIDKAQAAKPKKEEEKIKRLPAPLFPDTSFSFAGRRLEIDSFSALVRHAPPASKPGKPLAIKPAPYEEPGEAKAAGKDDDEAPASAEAEEPVAAVSPAAAKTLPPSKETGSMLHEIFEEIDFAKAKGMRSADDMLADREAAALIDRKLSRYSLGTEVYRDETAKIVWNTLHTPLPEADFTLASIAAGDKIHELEFFYPLPEAGALKVPEVKRSPEGFLMGFIDLVFRHKETYYILDWKSNYLDDGYSPESVQKSMDEADYHLQYKLYTIAVVRWLKHHIKDFDYDKNFGGIYYIYLRGRNGADPDEGAFFYCPNNEAEIKDYERMLCKMVSLPPAGRR